MDKLFLRENAYTTPQFKTNLGRDRKFKDKFVTFLGRLGGMNFVIIGGWGPIIGGIYTQFPPPPPVSAPLGTATVQEGRICG